VQAWNGDAGQRLIGAGAPARYPPRPAASVASSPHGAECNAGFRLIPDFAALIIRLLGCAPVAAPNFSKPTVALMVSRRMVLPASPVAAQHCVDAFAQQRFGEFLVGLDLAVHERLEDFRPCHRRLPSTLPASHRLVPRPAQSPKARCTISLRRYIPLTRLPPLRDRAALSLKGRGPSHSHRACGRSSNKRHVPRPVAAPGTYSLTARRSPVSIGASLHH